MNILLIGGSNSLINALIRKLNKEGHRVSLLTGSGYRQEAYERVFERHDFSYSSSSLTEVFESVAPDVTIFMGAQDSSFRWSNDQGESVRYISGMMNLLTAFSTLRRGRFVYLSCEDVFSGTDPKPIADDAPFDAIGFRGMAIAQGEELCESFRINRDLDILTLRLGGYYHTPENRDELDSTVASLCLEALWERKITVGAENRLSVLHESDAVEFIVRAALAPEHAHSRYNLTSAGLGERELADMIARQFEAKEKKLRRKNREPVKVAEDAPGGKRNLELDSARFREEFSIGHLRDTEEAVGAIVEYMVRHQEAFLLDLAPELPWWKRLTEKVGWLVRALLPFIENLVCFIPFFMLNNRAVGSQYFAKLDFYLLYVLLFAIMYGQQQATFSAILATCGYIFRQTYTRTGFEVLLDYNTYVWIAQLFILGLVVGYMKDRLNKQKAEAREDHAYMVDQLDDIKTINSSNVRVKDAIQNEVINQSDSVGKIYKITSVLSQYSQEEVLFYATDILKQLMGTEDVSIYTASGGYYVRLFTATSDRARSLGHSVKCADLGPLYEEISQRRVYINRELNPDLPMMADAIFDGDTIRLVIMIWRLPWERMTLGQANLLTVTDALIRDAVLNADRYLEAVRSERFIGDSPVLNESVFTALVKAYENAERRGLTEYSLVWVELPEELRNLRAAWQRTHGKESGTETQALPEPSEYVDAAAPVAEPAPVTEASSVERTPAEPVAAATDNGFYVPDLDFDLLPKDGETDRAAESAAVEPIVEPEPEAPVRSEAAVTLPPPEEQTFGGLLRLAVGVGLRNAANRVLGVKAEPAPVRAQPRVSAPVTAKPEPVPAAVSKPVAEAAAEAVSEPAAAPAAEPVTKPEPVAMPVSVTEPMMERAKQAELAFGERLSKLIRPNDYVGEFDSGDLYVLLTNTDTESAKFVIGRLEQAGFSCKLVERMPWQE